MSLINNDEIIMRKALQRRADLKFEYIITHLKEMDTKFPNHKKYLFLPIHKYIQNPNDVAMWTKRQYLENNMIMFLRNITTKYSLVKSELKDWTFIFVNMNELFILNCNEFNENTYNDIRSFFRKMKSKLGSMSLSDVDDDKIGDTEDNEEELIDSNISAGNEIINKVKSDIDDTSLPEDVKNKVKEAAEKKIKSSVEKVSNDKPETVINKKDKIDNTPKTLANFKITEQEPEEEKITDLKSSTNKLISKSQLEDESLKAVKEELQKITAPNISVQRLARINKIQKEMKDITIDDIPLKTTAS